MIQKIYGFTQGASAIPALKIWLFRGQQFCVFARLGPRQIDLPQHSDCIFISLAKCACLQYQKNRQDS